MTGKQRTVCDGLRYLARRVQEGAYGDGDDAFDDDDGAGGVPGHFLTTCMMQFLIT